MPELSQKERVMEITEKLEKGIKDLFESDKYKAYLNCMSKFHNYSLNNTMLIAAQMPEATLVAGYNSWTKDHERYVKKGEKGIQIIAPYKFNVTEQIETESGPKEQEKEIKGFKVSYVFDVSQTEGKELPLIESKELTGSADGYQRLFMALKKICPVPINFEQIETGAKGYYNEAANRIAIKSGMSENQTLKTMIHEIAHHRMHSKGMQEDGTMDRGSKEVEAESVAYTVCQHYGIDTSDYSFAYVAGWSKNHDTKELKASLDRIRVTANAMICSIDAEIAMNKSKDSKELKER